MSELTFLLPKLIELFAAATRFVKDAQDEDGVDADDIAKLVVATTHDWHPRVKGIRILDDEDTRYAAARFLAGIAINIAEKKIRKRKAKLRAAHDEQEKGE
jgi:hypothetical protein